MVVLTAAGVSINNIHATAGGSGLLSFASSLLIPSMSLTRNFNDRARAMLDLLPPPSPL